MGKPNLENMRKMGHNLDKKKKTNCSLGVKDAMH
jgi:hypothetical protein